MLRPLNEVRTGATGHPQLQADKAERLFLALRQGKTPCEIASAQGLRDHAAYHDASKH